MEQGREPDLNGKLVASSTRCENIGPMFAAATSGLVSVGSDVIDVGLVPTLRWSWRWSIIAHRRHRPHASQHPRWNALKFVGLMAPF